MESLILLTILPALYWLMRETNWLTIRLERYEISWYIDVGDDPSPLEDEYIDALLGYANNNHEGKYEDKKEAEYHAWLQERYADKLVLGTGHEAVDYPQYSWMAKEENQQARRNGEMIYQRGRNR